MAWYRSYSRDGDKYRRKAKAKPRTHSMYVFVCREAESRRQKYSRETEGQYKPQRFHRKLPGRLHHDGVQNGSILTPQCYCSCVCRIVQYCQTGRSNFELSLWLLSFGVRQPYGSEKCWPNFSWIHLKLSCRITGRHFKVYIKVHSSPHVSVLFNCLLHRFHFSNEAVQI